MCINAFKDFVTLDSWITHFHARTITVGCLEPMILYFAYRWSRCISDKLSYATHSFSCKITCIDANFKSQDGILYVVEFLFLHHG